MSQTLFDDEHVQATLEDQVLTLSWRKAVPDDTIGIPLARDLTAALSRSLADVPDRSLRMLIDVMRVQRTAPRANAIFMDWLKRDWRLFRVTAFATGNVLLRSSLKVASLIPGISVHGFPSLDEARAFISKA